MNSWQRWEAVAKPSAGSAFLRSQPAAISAATRRHLGFRIQAWGAFPNCRLNSRSSNRSLTEQSAASASGLIRHWFFARPLVLGATRGKENRFRHILHICREFMLFRADCNYISLCFTESLGGLRRASASCRTEAARSMAGAQKWAVLGRPGAHPAGGPQVALFYWARRAGSVG